MTINVPSHKLNTGAEIPAVGMGCWRGQPGRGIDEELERSLLHALKVGYRHLDTAAMYQNEADIGQIIKKSGINRSELFLTTKLMSSDHDNVESAMDESLKKLDTSYVDLYLMHWPQGTNAQGEPYGDEASRAKGPTFSETWAQMEEKCLKTGKARAIGVSNFSIDTLEVLLKTAKVVPAANQIECHPYLPEDDLEAYCQEKGIHLTNYSPLGASHLPIHADKDISAIAAERQISPGQVALSWAVQRGHSVCPKSANEKRMEENLHVIQLSEEEMKRINDISKLDPKRRTRLNVLACNKEDGTVFGWTPQQLGWDIGFKTLGVPGIVE